MKRPQISLMGAQSGDTYLVNFINEQSRYMDFLEETIYGIIVSEGMHIPKGLEHLFKEEI